MKNLKTFGLLLACIAVLYALTLGIRTIVNHYLNKPADSKTFTCGRTGQNHLVVIENSIASPARTNAKPCDTLAIKNTDSKIRLIAFGIHDHHQAYDGIAEKVLDKNQSFTVTLEQTGTFKFHDHLDDSTQGTFTVR